MKNAGSSFELASVDYKRDPRPTLAKMRATGSVVPVRLPFVGDTLIVVSHAGATGLLKNSKRFVQQPKNAGAKQRIGIQWWMPRTVRALGDSMIGQDDPEHRRLRGLVDQAFTRRGVEGLRGRIGEITDRLLDGMARERTVDLVDSFARRLPLMVISELLGLPEVDNERLQNWTKGLVNGSSFAAIAMAIPRLLIMSRYLQKQIDQARRTPRPGLLAELIAAEAEGQRLNDEELLAMVFLLFFAGHETTTHTISVGTLSLLQHPQLRDRLIAEPERWPLAVEELLRWCSTVEFSKPRYVAEAGDFHGVELQRGQTIFAGITAANYDSEVFEDPDVLNIDRDPNPHLAFGNGVHFCLGHQLARLELAIAFEKLFSRFPHLRLGVPEGDLRWKTNLGVRGLLNMPVVLE